MTPETLVGRPARELVRLVRNRQVTPVEVVAAHLDRISKADPRVGAFQLVRGERALEEALALERADVTRLPLAGVPVAIKDNIDLEGERTGHGVPAALQPPAGRDHEIVRRLRAAGAIVIGKTRVPELSVWGTSDGPMGAAHNPWDPTRTAGGSSGGSAAAVAAGMVPIAHGSDGLGSIRIPAAACGVVGIKPGRGVVPSHIGVSSWFGMAENGSLAMDVDDAAVMLSVMAADPALAVVTPGPAAVRIARSTVSPLAGVTIDAEYVHATVAIGETLARAGHRVTGADPAYPTRMALAVVARWLAGTAEEAEVLDAHPLPRRTRGHARAGRICRRLGAVRQKDEAAWRAQAMAFFATHDVLVTPALAQLPIAADGWWERSWVANLRANVRYAPFAAAWNLAGFPAVSVPAGVHATGLPLAVQLVAPPGGERLLLALAKQIESAQPWPRFRGTLRWQ